MLKAGVLLRVQNAAVWNEQQSSHFATLNALLSPVKGLLNRDDVSDVMLNADGSIWFESSVSGICKLTYPPLDGVKREAAIHIIANICGRNIDASYPGLACKLHGGGWHCRVQANIPPVVAQAVISFRVPSRLQYTLADLNAGGVMSSEQRYMLADAVRARKNIIVCGGTGSGKTTVSGALLAEIPPEERLFVIEDTPELQVVQPNSVQIITNYRYGLRQAVIDAMRHRPDRIIVGEIRDGAALELLKGWNTGHPGGVATLHANSAETVFSRLRQLVQEAVVTVPENLVEESVHVAVFLNRVKGKRVVERVIAGKGQEVV